MKITFLFGSPRSGDLLNATFSQLAPHDQLTVIANTTADLTAHGLRICPDIDAAGTTLSQTPPRQPSHNVDQHLTSFGPSLDWLPISDQEYARHIVRNQLLTLGYTLSQVSTALYPEIASQCRLLPISDEHVETHIVLPKVSDETISNSAIHVRQWHNSPELHRHTPERIVTVRLDQATPAPAVLTALTTADLVLIGPCDPITELGPMVAIPGVRDTLQELTVPVAWLAPPLSGTSAELLTQNLRAIDLEANLTSLATLYADFVSDLISTESGPRPELTRTTCHRMTPATETTDAEFLTQVVADCRSLTRSNEKHTPTAQPTERSL